MQNNNYLKQLLSKVQPLSFIKGVYPLNLPSLAYPCSLPTVNVMKLAQMGSHPFDSALNKASL